MDRRTVIKGAAVVGAGAWVAPTIESFTARAAAASPVPVQHSCCSCFNANGAFIGAAADDFTDLGCEAICAKAAPAGTLGTFLRFSATTSFIAKGVTETNPGCTFGTVYLNGLAGSGPALCPPQVELPTGVQCDHGAFLAS
jgi:hypothetical protein